MRTGAPSEGRTDTVVAWGVSTGKFMPQVGFFCYHNGSVVFRWRCTDFKRIGWGVYHRQFEASKKIKDIFSSGAVGLPNPSLMLCPAVVAAM